MEKLSDSPGTWKQLDYLNLEISAETRIQVSAFNLPCFASEPVVEHCLHSVASPQLNLCCDLLLLLVQRQARAPHTLLTEINSKLEYIRDSISVNTLNKLSVSVTNLTQTVTQLQEQVTLVTKQLETITQALL